MTSYGPLARFYDDLTTDVPYDEFIDFYIRTFAERGREVRTVLDLACGTGTLTCMMARRGYEMIGADGSAEMLSAAADKAERLEDCVKPLLLCQSMEELDLYGTVEAAVCSLDGFNYLPEEDIPEVLSRLKLFIEPGGVLIFDVNSPERLRSLDGEVFVDETEDVLCLWRAEFDPEENLLFYGMDIFTREGEMWSRDEEEHIEYAHSIDMLTERLSEAGFGDIEVRTDGPQHEQGRVFIISQRQ